MRVRGLKRHAPSLTRRSLYVAPRAGAWVETKTGKNLAINGMSHPVRVRGLKPVAGSAFSREF